MRYQGKVSNWKDDQGFGFVTPRGGGDRAFVHIKAFTGRVRRPVDGDLITYAVERDSKHRTTAKNIQFVGDGTAAIPSKATSFGSTLALGFCVFLVATVLMGKMPPVAIGLYLSASFITIIAYALDKSAAKKKRWRIKESTLHLFSIIGGWPGALLAQELLRHKSKKVEFQSVFWGTVVINCVGFCWLLTKSGSAFLASLLA